MRSIFYLLCFVCLMQGGVYADEDKDKKEKKGSWIGLVLPSRSPENGWNAQGGVMRVFKTNYLDSTLRASNLYLYGFYSQLHQYRFSIGGEVFTPEEKYYVLVWLYYSYSPEQFFGIGNTTDPEENEWISYRIYYSQLDVLRKIRKHWFAGINTRFEKPYDITYDRDGLFEDIYGS